MTNKYDAKCLFFSIKIVCVFFVVSHFIDAIEKLFRFFFVHCKNSVVHCEKSGQLQKYRKLWQTWIRLVHLPHSHFGNYFNMRLLSEKEKPTNFHCAFICCIECEYVFCLCCPVIIIIIIKEHGANYFKSTINMYNTSMSCCLLTLMLCDIWWNRGTFLLLQTIDRIKKERERERATTERSEKEIINNGQQSKRKNYCKLAMANDGKGTAF